MIEKEMSLKIKHLDGLVDFVKKITNNKYMSKKITYHYFEIPGNKDFYTRVEMIENLEDLSKRYNLTFKYGFKTFKTIKTRKEYTTEIKDYKFYMILFKKLGLIKRGIKHKIQYKFSYDNLKITINDWKELNPRIEIEGDSIAEIRTFANKIKDYVY